MLNDIESVEAQIERHGLACGLKDRIKQAFALWLQVKFLLSRRFSIQRIMENIQKIIPVLFSGDPLPVIVKRCVSIIRHRHRMARKGKWWPSE